METLREILHRHADELADALEGRSQEATPDHPVPKTRRPRTVRPIVQAAPIEVDELTRARALKYIRRANIGG